MGNVIDTPDYYSNLSELIDMIPAKKELNENERHAQSQERNRWDEKFACLTVANYSDTLNIPFGTT